MAAGTSTARRMRGPRTRLASEIYGSLYIWHFDEPIGNLANSRAQAQHYSGFAEGDELELLMRAAEHEAGVGAKIMRAVVERGVGHHLYVLERNVPKTREREIKRKLKNNRRICPVCRGHQAEEIDLATLPELPAEGADFDGEPYKGPMDWTEIRQLRGNNRYTPPAQPIAAELDEIGVF